jgi:uncharacterized membrane protein
VTTLYYVNVTLHVLAAMLWLGGMFFLGIVGAPVLRAIEPPQLRQRLFHDLGQRFRRASWWTIGALVVSGVANLYFRGWLHWSGVLASEDFWGSNAGRALAVKLCAVRVHLARGG